MHGPVRRSMLVAGLLLGLAACADTPAPTADTAPVRTATVQPVTATPLAPPASRAADARPAAGWAEAQRVLNNPSGDGAVRLYRALCHVGDASACRMAEALDPHPQRTRN